MQPNWIDQAIRGTSNPPRLLKAAMSDDMYPTLAYVVPHWTAPLPEAEYRVAHPVPSAAIKYLQVIVSGVHQEALAEWLCVVHKAGYQLQLDVLVLLVHFLVANDLLMPKWYPLMRETMGADGLQRVEFAVEVAGITSEQQQNIYDGLQHGGIVQNPAIEKTRMNAMSALLKSATTRCVPARLSGLNGIDRIWTRDLTCTFLDYLAIPDGQTPAQAHISYYAHFFALDVVDGALERLAQNSIQTGLLEKIALVVHFRKDMVAAIENRL